jgi:hypothetical protein
LQRYLQTFLKRFQYQHLKRIIRYLNTIITLDIENGFDGRTKKDALIELNYLPFREGKIKLEGVDLKNNVPYTYKITFFGSTVTLKDT